MVSESAVPHPDSEFPLEHQEDRWDQKRINTGTVSAELCLHYICFFLGGGPFGVEEFEEEMAAGDARVGSAAWKPDFFRESDSYRI